MEYSLRYNMQYSQLYAPRLLVVLILFSFEYENSRMMETKFEYKNDFPKTFEKS